MNIDREAVLHLAKLARLDISAAEADALGEDLRQILGYVQQLDDLDIAPNQEAPILGRRADHINPNRCEGLIEKSASTEGRFVHVPKIVETDA
tara:strand:- start:148 stop:426 length:279 start_codon:yes stop_codon:yes gene_type:complete